MTQIDQASDRRSTRHEETTLDAVREPAVYPEMRDLAELFEAPKLSLATTVRYAPADEIGGAVEVERRGHGYLIHTGSEGAARTYSIAPHGEVSELVDGTFVKRFDWEAVREVAEAIAPMREAVSRNSHGLEWRNAAGHPVSA